MYNLFLFQRQQREHIEAERLEKIGRSYNDPLMKERRDELSGFHNRRVRQWILDNEGKSGVIKSHAYHGLRESLNSITWKARVPELELGSPVMSPRRYIPEKDRIPESVRRNEALYLQGEPYRPPAISPFRCRDAHKDLAHSSFRFKIAPPEERRKKSTEAHHQPEEREDAGPNSSKTLLEALIAIRWREERPDKWTGKAFRVRTARGTTFEPAVKRDSIMPDTYETKASNTFGRKREPEKEMGAIFQPIVPSGRFLPPVNSRYRRQEGEMKPNPYPKAKIKLPKTYWNTTQGWANQVNADNLDPLTGISDSQTGKTLISARNLVQCAEGI